MQNPSHFQGDFAILHVVRSTAGVHFCPFCLIPCGSPAYAFSAARRAPGTDASRCTQGRSHKKLPAILRGMQFLFVRPRFCLRLLLDSASRRTPLSLADSSCCHACSGLSPPSYYACRAHKNKAPLLPETGFVSDLKGLRTLVLNPLSVICALLRSRVESPI